MPDHGHTRAVAPAPSAAEAVLTVRTLGHFEVRSGSKAIEIPSRKARALLAYLAFAEGRRDSRDRLMGLFWSESDEIRARASLRQALYEIREAFQAAGLSILTADRSTAAIEAAVAVDITSVMDWARQGRAHPLLLDTERPLDGLLAEFETVDPSFRAWILSRRQSYADRIAGYLQEALRGGADPEPLARALLNLDPTNEVAARVLMRSRVAAGDVGGALGVYRALWDVLTEEYDTEPSKETQDLIAEVKLGQPLAAPAPASSAGMSSVPRVQPPPRLVISIGSFDATGTSDRHRYLIQGFRRELIACLVRFREWIVRDQAELAAGERAPQGQIGEYIVDASAFESSGGLRLLIMLRDAHTNDYLWSERVELSVAHWLDGQQAVVKRLSTALNVYISAGRLGALTGEGPSDRSAYDLWLRGQAIMMRHFGGQARRAREVMLEIIQSAPAFAPAYSSLSQLNNSMHIGVPGVYLNRSTSEESITYARQAARLDPMDARSQLCLGWALTMAGSFDQGALHHELARDLNENDPWILVSTALGSAFRRDHENALLCSNRALSLLIEPSPIHWGYCAQIAFLRGDYEAANRFGRNAEGLFHFLGWTAAAAASAGNAALARETLGMFLAQARELWEGQDEATPEAITHWFLHGYPIRQRADWERLRAAIGAAGAPVEAIQYETCNVIPLLAGRSS